MIRLYPPGGILAGGRIATPLSSAPTPSSGGWVVGMIRMLPAGNGCDVPNHYFRVTLTSDYNNID